LKDDDLKLVLAGLTITVMGRECPNAYDEWDGNWLRIHISCIFSTAAIEFSAPCLTTTSFLAFKNKIERLQKGTADSATLESVEPNFSLTISKTDSLGHYQARIEVTSDHVLQGHWFEFEIDQSYFPTLISQCNSILKRHPVRG